MKVREVQRGLLENGFQLERQTGSHRIYRGYVDGKARLVSVAGRRGHDLPKGTLGAIRRQSGLGRRLGG